ncbi:serine/threonine protein kinase, putative [Hepatocystis sp. ex Piliocolobus tephrosceles]|nr:serine/threonine protein kinase, putative [Hepatocystis sp. ex Piliocolobus tephrosceles]
MLKLKTVYTSLIGGKIYNINGKTIREEKLISEGSFSFVYLARDMNTNKLYIIKKTICQTKEQLKQANSEITIFKTLPIHKNIVQYFGSNVIKENNFRIVIILLEYCENGNLLNILEKNKDKIKECHIVYILRDIVSGLNFLHTQEVPIIHRDIKLENILCDKNKVYKICDFCSYSISNLIYPNNLIKTDLNNLKEEINKNTTLIYRPPELVDMYDNFEISTKVDIWMVGCILYLLLFKIHPFQNNNILSIINCQFIIPNSAKCSKRILAILLMTLYKNPEKRIDSTTLLFILENYSDLKKWITYIPVDIRKKVNEIYDKMTEINSQNKKNEVIEITNDKNIDIKINLKNYNILTNKKTGGFLANFSTSYLIGDTFKKKVSTKVNTGKGGEENGVITMQGSSTTTTTTTATTTTATTTTATTTTATTTTDTTTTDTTTTDQTNQQLIEKQELDQKNNTSKITNVGTDKNMLIFNSKECKDKVYKSHTVNETELLIQLDDSDNNSGNEQNKSSNLFENMTNVSSVHNVSSGNLLDLDFKDNKESENNSNNIKNIHNMDNNKLDFFFDPWNFSAESETINTIDNFKTFNSVKQNDENNFFNENFNNINTKLHDGNIIDCVDMFNSHDLINNDCYTMHLNTKTKDNNLYSNSTEGDELKKTTKSKYNDKKKSEENIYGYNKNVYYTNNVKTNYNSYDYGFSKKMFLKKDTFTSSDEFDNINKNSNNFYSIDKSKFKTISGSLSSLNSDKRVSTSNNTSSNISKNFIPSDKNQKFAEFLEEFQKMSI